MTTFAEPTSRLLPGAVVVLGDAALDWLVRVPVLPPSGGSAWSRPPVGVAGGTGANVAVALRRLGVDVHLVTRVGDDDAGRVLVADLVAEGLDVSGVTVDAGSYTPVVLAIVDDSGERTLISCALDSAQGRLRTDDHDGVIGAAHWLHTTGILLAEEPSRTTALAAMEQARQSGVATSFDLNLRLTAEPASDLRAAVDRAVTLADVVFASESEAASLCGSRAAVAAWARGLGTTAIIRRGGLGVTVHDGGMAAEVPPPDVALVDTLGAGDIFDAGFIAARVAGAAAIEAARWGNAAAAVSIGRPGARSAPNREELERMLVRTPDSARGGLSYGR